MKRVIFFKKKNDPSPPVEQDDFNIKNRNIVIANELAGRLVHCYEAIVSCAPACETQSVSFTPVRAHLSRVQK